MIPAKAMAPFNIDWLVFITTEAKIEPIAMVDAKSKLDILANVRSPEILVINIITEKITINVTITLPKIGKEA
jgi:hypothetical protein